MRPLGILIVAVTASALVFVAFDAEARGGSRGGGYSSYSGGRSSGGLGSGVGRYGGTGSNPSSHYNRGYTTRQGTRVAPHYSTNPNSTRRDNYEARGNYNPHSGTFGRRWVDR